MYGVFFVHPVGQCVVLGSDHRAKHLFRGSAMDPPILVLTVCVTGTSFWPT